MLSIITQLGGRRYTMAMGCGVVCTLLVVAKVIEPIIFRDLILGTVAAYITGNVGEKIFSKTKDEA
jgi:uncharacterized membrane protein